MTNEETIKELKIIREDYWDEYKDPMPALDMAIKALEQQDRITQILDDYDLEAWEILEKIKEVVRI